jgi:VanZ family protein
MSKFIIPALIWLVIVTWLSVIPNLQLPPMEFVASDKVGHTAAYFLLCFLCLWGLSRRNPGRSPDKKQALYVMLFCAGYGVLMEFVQYFFIPGRYCEFYDMVANALGAVLGWLAFRLLFQRKLVKT